MKSFKRILFILLVSLSFLLQKSNATTLSLNEKLSKQNKKNNEYENSKILKRNVNEANPSAAHESSSSSDETDSQNDHASTSGGHHVAPPSYQLQPHTYSYKPNGFKIFTHQKSKNKIYVGFNYSEVNHYDRYMFRIRYHGYEEYSTNKMKLNRTDVNQVILKDFLDAQYIICVTLFSTSGMPEFQPLSTSDMCIDVVAGEAYPIGGHHSSTGLLAPLLLAVAAVLLIIITIGYSIKRAYLVRTKKEEHEKKLTDKVNNIVDKTNHTVDMKENDVDLNALSSILLGNQEFRRQAASRMCEIIENSSETNFQNNAYQNKAFDINDEYVNSLETLSHLLDDKPWISRSVSNDTGIGINKPMFFLKH